MWPSQNWQSTRTNIKSRKLRDLVTNSEASLNSQDYSLNYTQAGKRTNQTYGTSQRETEDFEDVIQQEISSLFITPQQELAIKNVLELVNKNVKVIDIQKITPLNAFQIPIKIIDPYATSSTNMRFWKFASELLQASMTIYQKRVDNVQIITHKMTNDLVRLKDSKQEVNEQQIERQNNNKKRNELITIDIKDLNASAKISTFELRHVHIGEADKINLRGGGMYMLKDPLFQKKMRSFDSTTLGSLMLNSFELGMNLQILFFGDYEIKINKQGPIVQFIQIQEDSVQIIEDQSWFFVNNFFENDFKKLRLMACTCQMYETIVHFKRINGFKNQQQNENQLKQQQLVQDYQTCLRNDSGNIFDQNSHEQHQIIDYNSSISRYDMGSDKSQYQNKMTQDNYLSCDLASSQKLFDKAWLQQGESMTIANPWQMEARGSKLIRNKLNKSRKSKTNNTTEGKTKKSRLQNTILQILFNNNKEKRANVLSIKQTQEILDAKGFEKERYIMPKNMNPLGVIIKNNKEKHSSNTQIEDSKVTSHFKTEYDQQKLPLPQNFLINEKRFLEEQNRSNSYHNIDQIPGQTEDLFSSSLQIIQNMTSTALQNYKTFGLKDIRQIKEYVHQQAVFNKQIWLSEVNINFSPAATLIVFLHLANQYNLQINARDDEADVVLLKNN